MVVQILFDPLSSILNLSGNIQARVGLPNAQAKWDAQKINHYEFDISGSSPTYCGFNGSIEVKDGKVISTGTRSDIDADLYPDAYLLPEGGTNTPFLCDYHNYTIPLLFDELQRWLRESPSLITGISFDRKYGFISHLRFGTPNGWGLLNPKMSHCCGGFTIENFQVLDE